MSVGLLEVLADAQAHGFLGPGPLDTHLSHAEGMARIAERALVGPPAACCDLGSGGGLPGLALALEWPSCRVTLLEGSSRRCGFLRAAISRLGLAGRVEVAEGRAEVLARTPEFTEHFELVVARSFGPPSSAAECAARLLVRGGMLLVAEPPGLGPEAARPDRWPASGLAQLGLALEGYERPPSTALIRAVAECPSRFPRRVGVPTKRPLF